MRQDRVNMYLSIGILLAGVSIGLNHFIRLPDFLYGLGLGLGIALELTGTFALSNNIKKIREFKRRILRALVK